MARAVVPIYANLMRAAAGARNSEKKPMMRAVKMTCGKRKLGELPADRAFMQRAVVRAQRAFVSVNKRRDLSRGYLAVFERARNTLAHQRIHSGRITGQ